MSQAWTKCAAAACCAAVVFAASPGQAGESDSAAAPPPAASDERQSPPVPSFPGIIVGPALPVTPHGTHAPNGQPPGCPVRDMKPLELLV
jgi:hypothetical protein